MKVFSSTCSVLHSQVKRSKLSSRSAKCIFLGYGDGQKGYCCYNPQSRKNYVSCCISWTHFLFLSLSLYSYISSEFTHIDLSGLDDNISSDCYFENRWSDTIVNPDIDIPFVPMTTQQPPTIVDPLSSRLRNPFHNRKST